MKWKINVKELTKSPVTNINMFWGNTLSEWVHNHILAFNMYINKFREEYMKKNKIRQSLNYVTKNMKVNIQQNKQNFIIIVCKYETCMNKDDSGTAANISIIYSALCMIIR